MLVRQNVRTDPDKNGNSRRAWVVFDTDKPLYVEQIVKVYPYSVEPTPEDIEHLPTGPAFYISVGQYGQLLRQEAYRQERREKWDSERGRSR